MSANKHGLGRGIDVLFRNTPSAPATDTSEKSSATLPLAVLKPCPYQPRRVFEDQPLEELAESIRSQGIVQPLLVRPIFGGTHYEIVAGERRYRAAKMAGLNDVPVVIREMSDDEALTAALVENLQREDLNPLEEAEAMHALRERLGESQEALASRLGKSRSAVANALRLLQLPEDMRQALAGNLFTPGHARAVLAIPEEDIQRQLYEAVVAQQLSVRDTESAVQHVKRTGQLPASIVSGESVARPAGSRSPKPELVRDVQRVLRETLGAKVTVSGSGDMGRVTIPYSSPTDLAELMQLLCAGQTQESLDPPSEMFPSTEERHAELRAEAAGDAENGAYAVMEPFAGNDTRLGNVKPLSESEVDDAPALDLHQIQDFSCEHENDVTSDEHRPDSQSRPLDAPQPPLYRTDSDSEKF